MKNKLRIEHFLMVIASLFWAFGHPAGRVLVTKVHPFQLGAVTLASGLLGVLVFMTSTGKIKDYIKINARDLLISLGLGVFGFFFYQILTFSALARIPASMNAVLVSTNVVFITLLAGLFLSEKIKIATVFGIAVAFTGVIFVTFNRGFVLSKTIDVLGCGFSILAALSFSFYSVLGKKVLMRNDPLTVASLALLSGAVLLNILTAFTVGYDEIVSAGTDALLLMIFLGLTMIGVAYPLWFACLKRVRASQVAIYIYLTPVFAVILSMIILKESFSWLFWVGGAFILGGIIFINTVKQGKISEKV